MKKRKQFRSQVLRLTDKMPFVVEPYYSREILIYLQEYSHFKTIQYRSFNDCYKGKDVVIL